MWCFLWLHDDVMKWKHFPRYWPFVRGIHRSPVNSPHKGQWRGALMISLIYACINSWVNPRKAGDVRRHRIHYDVSVMIFTKGLRALTPVCVKIRLVLSQQKRSVWSGLKFAHFTSAEPKCVTDWIICIKIKAKRIFTKFQPCAHNYQ